MLLSSLSKWASRHPWPARLLLVFGHFALPYLAFNLGLVLHHWGWGVPGWVGYVALLALVAAFLAFPQGRPAAGQGRTRQYRRQLRHHGYILVAGMGLCMAGVSFLLAGADVGAAPAASEGVARFTHHDGAAWPGVAHTVALRHADEGQALQRRKGWGVKKLLLLRLKSKQQRLFDDDDNRGRKTITAFLLMTLATVLLGTLVVAFSCSLACNGAEFAAIAVLIFGIVGIVALNAFLLRLFRPDLSVGKRFLYGLLVPLGVVLSIVMSTLIVELIAG